MTLRHSANSSSLSSSCDMMFWRGTRTLMLKIVVALIVYGQKRNVRTILLLISERQSGL